MWLLEYDICGLLFLLDNVDLKFFGSIILYVGVNLVLFFLEDFWIVFKFFFGLFLGWGWDFLVSYLVC